MFSRCLAMFHVKIMLTASAMLCVLQNVDMFLPDDTWYRIPEGNMLHQHCYEDFYSLKYNLLMWNSVSIQRELRFRKKRCVLQYCIS